MSVAPSAPSVVIKGTQNFTANVSYDPTSAGVTWTLGWNGSACTNATTCGSLTNVTTTSVTYNAPPSLPSPATVTLTATSRTDGTKVASSIITLATIAACGSGSESLLNGHYAFLLKGFDNGTPAEPALIGGVITADGTGRITAGSVDMNLNAGVSTGLSVTSGSYSIGSDHRGCITLTTSAGTQDYRFSLGGISGTGTAAVASIGHMIDFDSSGPFVTGKILMQDTTAFSTASVTGNFAFGVSSVQNTAETNNGISGGKFAAAGVFNLSAGVVSGGEVDTNGNGELDQSSSNTVWPSSPIPISSGGTYTIDSTNGRGTLTFTPSGASAVHSVIYVVSPGKFLILGSDTQTSNSTFAGTAMKQTGGSFSSSWLSGTGAYYESALGGAGTTKAQIGMIAGSGNSGSSGNFTITSYQNYEGSFASQKDVAGTFTIDASTGRVLVAGPAAGSHPAVLYAVSTNEAFILDSGGSVNSGFMQSQSGSFSASSVKGTLTFGTTEPQDPSVSDSVGVVTFDGISNITGTNDENSSGTLSADNPISQTYGVSSSGLANSPSSCTITGSTTCSTLFLFITPTQALELDTSSTHPSINTAAQ